MKLKSDSKEGLIKFKTQHVRFVRNVRKEWFIRKGDREGFLPKKD